ncbi:hypothetical protein UFOVP581_10 [uncultured Caudovirales phage]|uniref:Uncharacterized protein n=1 Tax=uncultured Caudovirales phage TaxID=2100421 RepID=A0A6J5PH92_9CAUD|nr:hypothetical protein UFOVP581_10 [uncultured Caudovirales phage]
MGLIMNNEKHFMEVIRMFGNINTVTNDDINEMIAVCNIDRIFDFSDFLVNHRPDLTNAIADAMDFLT